MAVKSIFGNSSFRAAPTRTVRIASTMPGAPGPGPYQQNVQAPVNPNQPPAQGFGNQGSFGPSQWGGGWNQQSPFQPGQQQSAPGYGDYDPNNPGFQHTKNLGPLEHQPVGWQTLEALYNEAQQYNRDTPQRMAALERYRRATDPGLAGARNDAARGSIFQRAQREGGNQAAALSNMGYGQAAQDAAMLGAQNNAQSLSNQAYLSEFDPEGRAKAALNGLQGYSPSLSLMTLNPQLALMNGIENWKATDSNVDAQKDQDSGGFLGGLLDIASSFIPVASAAKTLFKK